MQSVVGIFATRSAAELAVQAADIGVQKGRHVSVRDLLKRGRSLVIANIDDPGLVSVAQSDYAGHTVKA